MIRRRSVKKPPSWRNDCCVVGVIGSKAELMRAIRLRKPPDLFELRLDRLKNVLDTVQSKLSMFRAPFIITARDPREGGANNLSIDVRRQLLLRFLPQASYVDIELRCARRLQRVIKLTHKKNARVIISFHDFVATPDLRSLCAMARGAKSLGADTFKVASRTDTPAQVACLLEFIGNVGVDLSVSIVGIGKLGRTARREFIRKGSILNYAAVDGASVAGQPTLSEIRRWTRGVQH